MTLSEQLRIEMELALDEISELSSARRSVLVDVSDMVQQRLEKLVRKLGDIAGTDSAALSFASNQLARLASEARHDRISDILQERATEFGRRKLAHEQVETRRSRRTRRRRFGPEEEHAGQPIH